MRIISGKFKSKRIYAPKNLPVRPTTDMAKEALFNILNHQYYFDSIHVLDLFTGTGNISYEFASRGCEKITAVDAHYNCVKFVRETSKTLQIPIDAIKMDVYKYLQKCPLKFDVIFADPPYNFDLVQFQEIVSLIFVNDLLEEDGVLILEHSKHTKLNDHPLLSYQKKYGGNIFSFFEKAPL